jgi:hypothetical protein
MSCIKNILLYTILIIILYLNLIINNYIFKLNPYLGLLAPFISIVLWLFVLNKFFSDDK